MYPFRYLHIALLTIGVWIGVQNSFSQNNYTQYVNPFLGTGGHGHTFPGATLPFAMVQLSPDTRIDGSWDGCSAYHYSDALIYGFSHTHLSGTGCSDYGDVSFLPSFSKHKNEVSNTITTSGQRFKHNTEKALPGYYCVVLDSGKIKVELTATTRVGFQKYTFSQAGYAWVYLDLQHRDKLLEGRITQVSKNVFSGLRRSKAWAEDQLLYFYFETDKIPEKILIDSSSKGQQMLKLLFKVDAGQSVQIKTALSSVSEAGAQLNFNTELPHWNFEKVKTEASLKWNSELSKIKVYGKSLADKQKFYTALYHCMMHPNIMNDADGQYRGRDKQIHKAVGFDYYTVFSLWDTYRALHPLLNIIDKKRSHDFIMTFKVQYEQSGRLPMWELWGNETNCMIGFHSVSVVLDAYRKDVISKEELEAIYPAVRAEAMSSRFGLDVFRDKGFLSIEDENESVSKTLEYSYDMSCVSMIAFLLHKNEDGALFGKYSEGWNNIYDEKSGFFIPRSNGGWIKDFDPKQVNNHFTEANAWQYAFAVQHNISIVSNPAKVSTMFNSESKTSGRNQSDITGMIGQYAQGNEPSHHIAYLFNNLDSSKKYLNRICSQLYTLGAEGLCGNEDCGQMSAWYVFTAMGFYPVNPGSSKYYFGAMIFDSVKFVNGNSKSCIYRNFNPKKNSEYEKSTTLEQLVDVNYFGYSKYDQRDISGGRGYLSAPVINAQNQVFNDSVIIYLQSNTRRIGYGNGKNYYPQETIYYTVDGSAPDIHSKVYKDKPLVLYGSTTMRAISISESGLSSYPITANFYKHPNDYAIQIKSICNPQYTAGGPLALFDGLLGDENWRKGRWQGYQGQNFVAVVDLQKESNFDTVSIGLLSDLRSWICLPKNITIYGSNDSLHFDALMTRNMEDMDSNYTVARYLIQFDCKNKNYSYRYLKIEMLNYGQLPQWHQGAGGDAFIFIDEIEIH